MKRYLITLLVAAAFNGAAAQSVADSVATHHSSSTTQTMADAFRAMPDSLLPYLSKNNRLDLVDFIESKMTARVTNAFDGETTLDTLSTDYLSLTLSPSSVMEMRLLPSTKHQSPTANHPSPITHIIQTTLTLGEKHKVRVVKTYTSKWSPLD